MFGIRRRNESRCIFDSKQPREDPFCNLEVDSVSFVDRPHALQHHAEHAKQNEREKNNVKTPTGGCVVSEDHFIPFVSPMSTIVFDKVRVDIVRTKTAELQAKDTASGVSGLSGRSGAGCY